MFLFWINIAIVLAAVRITGKKMRTKAAQAAMLLRSESLPAAKKGLQPRDGMCRHKAAGGIRGMTYTGP